MLKSVLTRVDFPRPDSPETDQYGNNGGLRTMKLTDNHDVKVEAFPDTLAMPLVWQVGESDESCQLSAHNVSHVAGSSGGDLGVGG